MGQDGRREHQFRPFGGNLRPGPRLHPEPEVRIRREHAGIRPERLGEHRRALFVRRIVGFADLDDRIELAVGQLHGLGLARLCGRPGRRDDALFLLAGRCRHGQFAAIATAENREHEVVDNLGLVPNRPGVIVEVVTRRLLRLLLERENRPPALDLRVHRPEGGFGNARRVVDRLRKRADAEGNRLNRRFLHVPPRGVEGLARLGLGIVEQIRERKDRRLLVHLLVAFDLLHRGDIGGFRGQRNGLDHRGHHEIEPLLPRDAGTDDALTATIVIEWLEFLAHFLDDGNIAARPLLVVQDLVRAVHLRPIDLRGLDAFRLGGIPRGIGRPLGLHAFGQLFFPVRAVLVPAEGFRLVFGPEVLRDPNHLVAVAILPKPAARFAHEARKVHGRGQRLRFLAKLGLVRLFRHVHGNERPAGIATVRFHMGRVEPD